MQNVCRYPNFFSFLSLHLKRRIFRIKYKFTFLFYWITTIVGAASHDGAQQQSCLLLIRPFQHAFYGFCRWGKCLQEIFFFLFFFRLVFFRHTLVYLWRTLKQFYLNKKKKNKCAVLRVRKRKRKKGEEGWGCFCFQYLERLCDIIYRIRPITIYSILMCM